MPSLPSRAAAAAEEAVCTRCLTVILEEDSAIAMLYGSYRVPSIRALHQFKLCGMCALQFQEFLLPELAHDADHQAVKLELISLWG